MTLLAGDAERGDGERHPQPMADNARQRARATCAEPPRGNTKRRDDATPERRTGGGRLSPLTQLRIFRPTALPTIPRDVLTCTALEHGQC